MPKYQVTLRVPMYFSTEIEVDAKTETEACEAAYHQVAADNPLSWGSPTVGELEVVDAAQMLTSAEWMERLKNHG